MRLFPISFLYSDLDFFCTLIFLYLDFFFCPDLCHSLFVCTAKLRGEGVRGEKGEGVLTGISFV